MNHEEDLRTLLLNQASITAIVGEFGVFVDDAGQTDLAAYLIISQQGLNPKAHLTQTSGIYFADIDIDCFSRTKKQARQLANLVTVLLKDYSGEIDSTNFHAVNWEDEGTDLVKSEDGSAVHYHVITEAYTFQVEEL